MANTKSNLKLANGASFTVDFSVSESGRRRPEYTLDSDIKGEMTLKDLLDWMKVALIVTADTVLKEEQAMGFDDKPVLYVDGRKNKQVSNVSPLGQIEFTARQQMSDIVKDTYEGILYRSREVTGRYKDSNYVFHNGKQIATNMSQLETWLASSPELKEKDVIRFVNIQPYARKLERYGITAQKSKTRYYDPSKKKNSKTTRLVMVPNGTYYLTSRAIAYKYKRNTQIRFQFLSGASMGIAGSFKTAGRGGRKSSGRPYLYPSITLTVSERGVL